ncbi:uncharacterized protein [Ptychodera flava]|uniref:uncharacterized protein n=1 Tax=Ptychodera flava TaxID=63121 RepID=UPI00396A8F2D
MRWQLMRDQTEAESGEGICLGEESHILNIPRGELPRRICRHSVDISTKFKHNDKVSLTFTAKNGGYIKINNYDLPNVTVDDAQFYGEVVTERTVAVLFDFVPPQHCSVTSSDCKARILDVGNPYKRQRDVTVTWEPSDWTDVPAGVHHYDCEAFRLSADQTGQSLLGIRTTTSHAAERNINASVSSVELRLTDTGVFAIILSVHDAVGNVARARRFLIFDESSVIQVDENNPIAALEAHQHSGIVWLNKSKGKMTVLWEGHFYNSFYRDGQFLNGIEEGQPSRWLYDEETGQPPSSRSREPIRNDNGVIRYKLGFVESTSGSTDPEDWTDLGQASTSHVITISDDNNKFITVWLKAFDVMNNTIEDKATFYIDKTQPTISSMTVVDDSSTRNTTSRRKKMAPSGSGVLVKTHDDDSGILEVKWQIFDKIETTRLYGQGKIGETTPIGNPNKPCTALTCTCLPEIDVCFYLDYLIEIDSRDLPDLPTGDTECIVKVTAVNNAMLETTDQVEILLKSTAAPKVQAGASTGSNVGGIAGGSSVVIVIIVVVVVLIVIVVLRRRKRRELSNAASDRPITFTGVAKELGEENPSFESQMEAGKGKNNYSQHGKILNTAKAASTKADDSALSREEMEFSSTRLVLREKLQPGIHRATATSIGGKTGDTIVAVKAMKDASNRTQREHLMNELDIMLAIIPHENIIRLLGCITQTGSPKPSIIMEFAPYGNLGVVLKRSTRESQIFAEGGSGNDDGEDIYAYNDAFEIKNPVKSENLMLFAEQIATGMEHLSSLKIIHRKLGVRNVMVGDGKICKIASFSHAIRTDQQSVVDKVGGRIPIRWMAPESLTGNEFSFKSDVWTYGIVMWEIVTLGKSIGLIPYDVSSVIDM